MINFICCITVVIVAAIACRNWALYIYHCKYVSLAYQDTLFDAMMRAYDNCKHYLKLSAISTIITGIVIVAIVVLKNFS